MLPYPARALLHPVVAGWYSAIEDLPVRPPPCRHLAPAKWAAVRKHALTFCVQYGNEAHRLGWTAPELFAVHPRQGTNGVDACGVLMLGAGAARGVDAARVISERTSGYRNGWGQEWGIPLWEFARAGSR